MSKTELLDALTIAKARLNEAVNWHTFSPQHDDDGWCCKRESELRDEVMALEMGVAATAERTPPDADLEYWKQTAENRQKRIIELLEEKLAQPPAAAEAEREKLSNALREVNSLQHQMAIELDQIPQQPRIEYWTRKMEQVICDALAIRSGASSEGDGK